MEILRVRDVRLGPDAPLRIEFELPGRSTLIRTRGNVVFERDGARTGFVGLRFAALTPEHARLIDEYVRDAVGVS
jgi:hypothetical protein